MGPEYTEDEVHRSLLAVIACAGNIAAAKRELEDQNVPVTESTLRRWVNHDHSAEYHRLRDEHAPDLEARLAHEFRDVASRAVEVQKLALAKALTRLENNQDDDPAKTAQFAARTGQSAVDKLMTLTNRPDKIIGDQRGIDELLRSLAARKIIHMIPETTAVNGTATEEHDAR